MPAMVYLFSLIITLYNKVYLYYTTVAQRGCALRNWFRKIHRFFARIGFESSRQPRRPSTRMSSKHNGPE